MTTTKAIKPLGGRAYGTVGHLPGSRMGPADYRIDPGTAACMTEKTKLKTDLVIVQEKLDGSCVAVARVGGDLIPLIRAGHHAKTSQKTGHRFFGEWFDANVSRFDFLEDGERLIGEWLAVAHGTRYQLAHQPFVPFDLMRAHDRATHSELVDRVGDRLVTPTLVWKDHAACPIEYAMGRVSAVSHHGAIDLIEGCVWRRELASGVIEIAKYVRPDKIDGCYLPEVSGSDPIWNWRP